MNQTIINCKSDALSDIKELHLFYCYNNGELNVIVPSVDFDEQHAIKDPNEQLVYHYGLNYDHVNYVESTV